MLNYSKDKHDVEYLLSNSMNDRRQLDRFLDTELKKQIIHDASDLSEELLEMKTISDAIGQVAILKNMEGILFADKEEDFANCNLDEGYEAAFLSEKSLKKIPMARRIAMTQSLLKVMDELDQNEIYPGIINLNAIVYDKSGVSDQVYLARVSCFQLGRLRQTWDEISEIAYDEDNTAMSALYPFFDDNCQNIAYSRLINRLISNKRLTEKLSGDEILTPMDLAEELISMKEDLLTPMTKKTGVWIVISDSISYEDSYRYVEESALINTMLLSASTQMENHDLYVNYLWCGRSNDERGGSGAIYSRGMTRFDGTFIPDIPFPKKEHTQSPTKGKNLMKAFVSAEYEMKMTDYDNKLLIIFGPRETDQHSNQIINMCRLSDIKNSFVVLFNNNCIWNTTGEADYLLNTSNRDDLQNLYKWICSHLSL